MKVEWNKRYTTIAVYAFLTCAALIGLVTVILYFPWLYGAVVTMLSVLSPFLYGFAIAYILNPLYKKFLLLFSRILLKKKDKKEHKKLRHHSRRGGGSEKAAHVLSILTTYICFLLFLFVFFWILIPQLTESAKELASSLPSYLETAKGWVNDFFDRVNLPSLKLVDTEGDLLSIIDKGIEVVTKYSPQIIDAVSRVALELKNAFLGVLVSIYMLAGKNKFKAQSKKVLYALFRKDHAERILSGARDAHTTFGGFIIGKLLDSIIIGILCFIGMSILRLPYTVLISVVVGITNFIPFFGPFLGAIPSAFILLLVDPLGTVWFVLFIIVLQQLDGNFIGPKILGQTTGLSSFWVIFSLLVMGGLYGIFGMIIAVPVFSLLYHAIKAFCERLLRKKGLPPHTAAYEAEGGVDAEQEQS